MKNLFVNLYKHPYTVTNTIKDIKIHIVSMQRYMKDIALSTNNIEMKRAIFFVNQHEKNVLNSFIILEDRFWGDESKVLIVKDAFLKWKPIREEVITNMKQGEFRKAAMITKKKGYKYINSLNQKMKHLTDLETKKGLDFYLSVIKTVEAIYFVIVISLILILIVGVVILFFITRYITTQLSSLQKGLLNFFKYLNKETKSITLLYQDSNDDIGKISQTINSNIIHTQSIIENEKKLYRQVQKKQLQIISLNENLELRVKEEVDKNMQKEKSLFQQSKMAAMGEMIANIAHQWRQPLSTLNGLYLNLDIDFNNKKLSKKVFDNYILKMEEITMYLSSTIRDFSCFFDIDKKKEKFVINSILKKSISMIGPSLSKEDINLIVNLKEEIEINAYPSEFMQVVFSIINNSKDAFNKQSINNKEIIISLYQDSKNIFLEFEDNAGGIKKELVNKIFEPYFTTKHKSQGTGLGLYIAQTIIEKSFEGGLYVKNTNNGVLFTIKLNRIIYK